MSNPNSLSEICDRIRARLDQWRTLTVAEGEAIRLGRWCEVEQLQRAKQQLQPLIQQAIDGWRTLLAGREHDTVSAGFRHSVAELIQQETANAECIAARRRRMQHVREELESTTRQLHHVRQAYAPAAPVLWQSFS